MSEPSLPLQVNHLQVLVIAPVGRDSKLICDALAGNGIQAEDVRTVATAISILERQSVGALLITEEMLDPLTVKALSEQLSLQPAWSDLPVLILTVGGSATTLSRKREQDRLPLGSVTLLERPIRMATLTSSVRSALRSRSRQYQVRDTLLERDLAESARRDSESRLLLAVETARLGSWELHMRTGELTVSSTCRQHFDWDEGTTLTHQDAVDRVHPDDRSAVAEKLEATLQQGVPYAAEFRVVWRDGSVHWLSSTGRLLTREAKPGAWSEADKQHLARIAGVTLDITERLLSEAALRNADKLALVGRLSSSIAHEINNPLEAVTNLLYLLDRSEIDGVQRDYVNLAQRELARVSDITAQTLTFNRQQNSHEQAVLTDILDSVLALYQGRLTTSNIQVTREYLYQKPVLCYPGELRQVFTNIIANAFDATRRGGKILIRERLANDVHARRGVKVTIADTGSGMSNDVKRRIFEAFYSTKGNNGTGLGLWISRGIVEKHKGTLRFSTSTSENHHGTVFSIFLPIDR